MMRYGFFLFVALSVGEEFPILSAREQMMRRLRLLEWKPEPKECPPSANADGIICTDDADTCVASLQLREDARRQNIDRALCLAWNTTSGYGLSKEEEAEILLASDPAESPSKKECRAATYGEVTTSSVRAIVASMGISTARDSVIFMDLGSGVGKFITQAYLEWPEVVESSGIELSVSRSNEARQAWHWLLTDGHVQALCGTIKDVSEHSHAVKFLQGDFFHADVGNVTHMYISSVCFNDGMLYKLSHKLSREAKQMLMIASLRQFPSGVVGFEAAGRVDVDMSWTHGSGKATSLFLYRRN